MKKNKKLMYALIYVGITLLLLIIYYFALPPINPQDPGFWMFLALIAFSYMVPFGFIKKEVETTNKNGKAKTISFPVRAKKFLLFALIPVAVIILGEMFSSTVFNARKYADIITVENSDFATDMPQSDKITNVALMDSETASITANRKLGSLRDSVSQYELSSQYNQISYGGKPQKVSNLEYVDFFRWAGNRKAGIPGYVMIDPVNLVADYVKLATPMKYAESGCFGDDLIRKLRFRYPTKIFGTPRFEIDDEGNPYYIVPCMRAEVFMFGAFDVNKVIIFNPCTGESQMFSTSEIPQWVDTIYDGDLALQKYNWQGNLSGGWINSKIGKKGCKRTTDDFGYIVLEDDVWYFTGVTSVTNDTSNIGFVLTNARTGEYKFYSVIGAEEHSAMKSAEGEVQEKGYRASFPSLVNVGGEPAYIMVLKDQGGLVKLHAFVNVANSGLVATGDDQEDALRNYKKVLASNGKLDEGEENEIFTVKVLSVTYTVQHGNSVYYYQVSEGGKNVYYRLSVVDNERAFLIKAGDTLKIKRSKTEKEDFYQIRELIEIINS